LEPERLKLLGRVNYFQAPANPKGLVVFFPGCDRTGYGFWPNSHKCPECAGLPEDVSDTKQVLAKGYAVLVLTAAGPSICWQQATDGDFVTKVMPQFMAMYPHYKTKPVYAWGASSGGTVMRHNLGVKISGIMAVVATTTDIPSIIKSHTNHPPIAWITMSDKKEIDTARQHVADYSKYGRAAMATSAVKRITSTFFSDRCPPLTAAESSQMVAWLEKNGVIDSKGSLKINPKDNRSWLTKITAAFPFLKNSKDFQTAPLPKASLLQELLVAQSHHEHTSEYTTAMLTWFESGAKGDFAELAKSCRVEKLALLPRPGAFAGKCGAIGSEELIV
jgi:hypothetical protein